MLHFKFVDDSHYIKRHVADPTPSQHELEECRILEVCKEIEENDDRIMNDFITEAFSEISVEERKMLENCRMKESPKPLINVMHTPKNPGVTRVSAAALEEVELAESKAAQRRSTEQVEEMRNHLEKRSKETSERRDRAILIEAARLKKTGNPLVKRILK